MKMVSPRQARCHSHRGISPLWLSSKGFLLSGDGGGLGTGGWAGRLDFCFSSATDLPCDLGGEAPVPSGVRLSS